MTCLLQPVPLILLCMLLLAACASLGAHHDGFRRQMSTLSTGAVQV